MADALIVPQRPQRRGVQFAVGDGSVRLVRDSIPLTTFRAMGTRAGGEVVTND